MSQGSAETLDENNPWIPAVVLAVILGVLFGFVTRTAVGAAWVACGIGSESSNGTPWQLTLLSVLATVSTGVGVALVLARVGPRRPVLAAAVVMVTLTLVLWGVMAVIGTPANAPDPVCHPGNVPPWIPSWLPM